MTDAPERDEHGRFKPRDGVSGPHRADWTPRVERGLRDAEGVLEGHLSPEAAMLAMGLDPDLWEVTSYRTSTWGAAGAEKNSTRISVKVRERPLVATEDLADLLRDVETWGTPKPPLRMYDPGNEAFVVALADWQVGGTGPGGGTRDTIARVLALGGSVSARVAELREAGRPLPHLVVIGLGDLVEACSGFYSNQAHSVDLDNREQMKVAFRLLVALLRQWAELFPRVTVAAIGGNHGEVRNNGKVETGPNDNRDVLAFEIAQDVLSERPGYDHIEWHIPAGELSAVTKAGGVVLGYTHGHLFSGGANAGAKAEKWWKGQTFGQQPVKDAQILFSGHFHHFSATEFSDAGRTWFQTPAMDNGSEWFTNFSGQSSAPGTLTMRVGRACGPRLWDDLAIL